MVKPDKSATTYVYSVTAPPEQVQRRLVSDLLDRAFDGAAQELVLRALESSKASKQDPQGHPQADREAGEESR
ncbi:MAG: BlaI/MecI/CopY family transcriptional regulator [Verrucomicrobiota bacterium]